jgi:hypothetical protein
MLAAVAASLGLIVLDSPGALVQDSWSTLVAGRLVAAAGIPHHELLTAWAHGRAWIDQQWGAQLLFYRVEAFGGMRAVVASSALLSAFAWVGALALARRRGASGLALALCGPVTLRVAPWALQARAQSFALPLFVLLIALVFADSRTRSRRVFLALPLLAVWGNLHGTALLGACIVALHALVTLVGDVRARVRIGRSMVRATALAGGGFLALAANPYGFGIASYYRTMLVDPPFATMIGEWKHSTLSATTAPFYVVALVGAAIVIRHRRRLTKTEAVVYLFLFAAAVDAVRSIPWFALATLVIVPPLLPARSASGSRFAAPARAGLLAGTLIGLVVAVGTFSGSASADLARDWSAPGARALTTAADRLPDARVLADDRHADFLLWQAPELQGRVLADVRFELLNRRELRRLARFESDPRPSDASAAQLIVLDPQHDALGPWRARGWKQLYADASIVVYERPTS